jgi:hypothetical protein
MSMNTSHYIGFYFKCEKKNDVDMDALFPDEEFYRVHDEGGSKEINDFHIYTPNRKCEGCFTLSKYSETGLRTCSTNSLQSVPDLIIHGGEVLRTCYEHVALCFGVVSWVS